MAKKQLTIIIPVYNEQETLAELLERVRVAPLAVSRQIIIVDDGSTDQSPEILKQWAAAHPKLELQLIHQANGGKGSAVRAGIQVSTGDVVIIQDADLEYDPQDYPKCIDPILAGEFEVVYGSRELAPGKRRHASWASYLGGRAVTTWFNLLYGARLTDEPTCYKAFAGELIRALLFTGNGFEWEPEITAKLLRLGFRIHEVPISYSPRKPHEGKKIRWTDGFRALWEAWRWRFKSLAAERRKLAQWRSAQDSS